MHEITSGDKEGWRATVSDFELETSFQLDSSEKVYEMPDEEQLAIVTTEVTNPTSNMDTWEHSEEFVVIEQDGTVKRPNAEGDFRHSAFSDEISFREIRGIEHMGQTRPEGYSIHPGETQTLWWVAVVPRKISTRTLQIGFGGYRDEVQANYPVRWLIDAGCSSPTLENSTSSRRYDNPTVPSTRKPQSRSNKSKGVLY